MNQSEEKKKGRRNEEEENDGKNSSNEEDERRYEEEDEEEEDMQGERKQRSGGGGTERERRREERRQRRRGVEGKERGGEKERGKKRGKQDEGRYEREISPDHIPLCPVAAPYLKWKVFVRGSESTLGGRSLTNEGEEWRVKNRFTSTLDGEATRSFYENVTGQTDTQTDRETDRQFGRHTDTQTDRETEKDSNKQKDNNTDGFGDTDKDSENCRETDRDELRTDIDGNRETDRDRDKQEKTDRYRETEMNTNTDNRQRERHRHSARNRLRKANTDIHRQTQKSALNTHPSHTGDTHPHTHPSTSTSAPTPTSTPTLQDTHTALRFAQNNDVTGLTAMLNRGMSINTKDGYGWSLLMVAACAGAADVVRMLLTRGARTGLRDAKGNTALYLATIKGHRCVTEMLVKANKRRRPEMEDDRERNGESSSSETMEDEEYFCDTCGTTVKEQERVKHKASIVHQFKTESGPVRTHYGIPPTNRGYQLLVGQGWDTEGGLGSERQGQKFPVKTVLKRDREGLGAGGEGKDKARVTHFGPGDAAAVRRSRGGGVRVERAGTVSRREMRRRKEREQKEEVRLRRMLNEPDY